MVATRIGAMRIVVCASPALLEGRAAPAAPQDLLHWPTIAVDPPLRGSGWRFRQPGSANAIEIQVVPRLSVTTTEAAAQAAVLGVGIVRLLHYQAAEALETGTLRLLLEEVEPQPAPVHLVHAARGQLPLKMRRFLDFAKPRLRERLAKLATRSAGEADRLPPHREASPAASGEAAAPLLPSRA